MKNNNSERQAGSLQEIFLMIRSLKDILHVNDIIIIPVMAVITQFYHSVL